MTVKMQKQTTQELIEGINETCKGREQIRLMEVCGTHTVSLFRSGVKSLMPSELRLISGPGCPVCVTAQGYIDAASELASRPGVTVCTYGDMMRVPGRNGSLSEAKAQGGNVLVVYSTRDALKFAEEHPKKTVVFLAVGFETTAPATAAAILEAEKRNLDNFLILPGHKLVIPAMMALLSSGDVPIDGFMCPGHVSVVIGTKAYQPIVDEYHKPCVVIGFEPRQMLLGISALIKQVIDGEARVENTYNIAVTEEGNTIAWELITDIFEPAPTVWRAIGSIDDSGLALREKYRRFDASAQFELDLDEDYENPGCLCGQVIQGKVNPNECSLFGTTCTPVHPIGPCMVSSEGTCAAWYKYAIKK